MQCLFRPLKTAHLLRCAKSVGSHFSSDFVLDHEHDHGFFSLPIACCLLCEFALFYAKIASAWSPIRDHYNLKGDRDKEEIPLGYTDSLDLADKDINANWDIYQDRFLRGDFP